MRYVATSLLLAWFTVSATSPLKADSTTPPDTASGKTAAVTIPPEETDAQKAYGVHEETPNQRRMRLGQPIVASYPAPSYGEAIETPNHRRARLGLPAPESDAYGVTAETPNQRRDRLANQTAALPH